MNNKSVQEEVKNGMNKISGEEKEKILKNFETFKNYLGNQVAKGEKIGLSNETIAKGAQKIGDYLASKEEPRNSEEKLLQEMWQVSDKTQQHTLAHILVNLAKETN